MRVLFVSSGNKKGGISSIVFNQGESLKKQGIEIGYYGVEGKGLIGYLKHWYPLAKTIRQGGYTVVHAHYSLCGFLATLATPLHIPIVVSLMGTFRPNTLKYFVIRCLAKYRWKSIIVKSQRMKTQIGLPEAHLIPNGVTLEKFSMSQSRERIRESLGLAPAQKVVIFVSNPARPEKNFALSRSIVDQLGDNTVDLIAVFDKPHTEVAKYMLAADALLLTSFTEGSPNVIKEAMAAGCPIVCTNVGDVQYLLGGLAGTYIMETYTATEGAILLKKALEFGCRTAGRQQLIKLQLTDSEVAAKIRTLYAASI